MTIQGLAHLPDPREKLKESRIPVMVIRVRCDSQPLGFASEHLELFPDHRMTVIPGAGHAAYVEQPGLYTGAIRTFLAGEASSPDDLRGSAG